MLPLFPPRSLVLDVECVSEAPMRLVKRQIAGPPPLQKDLAGLGWSLRLCISTRVAGGAAGPGIAL